MLTRKISSYCCLLLYKNRLNTPSPQPPAPPRLVPTHCNYLGNTKHGANVNVETDAPRLCCCAKPKGSICLLVKLADTAFSILRVYLSGSAHPGYNTKDILFDTRR